MADTTNNKKSSSHERKVDAYLKPSNFSYIQTYVQNHGGSESAAVNAAVTLARQVSAAQADKK